MAEQGSKTVVGQGRGSCTRGESALERQEALLTTKIQKLQLLAEAAGKMKQPVINRQPRNERRFHDNKLKTYGEVRQKLWVNMATLLSSHMEG